MDASGPALWFNVDVSVNAKTCFVVTILTVTPPSPLHSSLLYSFPVNVTVTVGEYG